MEDISEYLESIGLMILGNLERIRTELPANYITLELALKGERSLNEIIGMEGRVRCKIAKDIAAGIERKIILTPPFKVGIQEAIKWNSAIEEALVEDQIERLLGPELGPNGEKINKLYS